MKNAQAYSVAIIGGGPAGLMAAEILARNPRFQVTVYDAMRTVGRKLLMAGRGGLNITHSEPFDDFIARYGVHAETLRPAIERFSPKDVRAWCDELEQPTFVGTSGRVFPEAMKASGLLRAWLRRLGKRGVNFKLRHRWTGWDQAKRLTFSTAEGELAKSADATLLALGGASWPRLGSDGRWVDVLEREGISVAPLLPANCGFHIDWSDVFCTRFEGTPIKNVALMHDGCVVHGEAFVTRNGIEGGAVYALSASLRDAVLSQGCTELQIDLKPGQSEIALATLLQKPRGKQSLSAHLRKAAALSPLSIGLLNETAIQRGQRLNDLSVARLAALIKSVALPITGIASIKRAISTAGGVRFKAIDEHYMLLKKPGVFVAGEMLDWEAPTGGYLLQACLATGAEAARGVDAWLQK